MDVLQTIKRLVLRGNVLFTLKAEDEMARDDLDEDLVCEYVIVGVSFDGTVIYTKGKILKVENREVFYVLVSSKKSTS